MWEKLKDLATNLIRLPGFICMLALALIIRKWNAKKFAR